MSTVKSILNSIEPQQHDEAHCALQTWWSGATKRDRLQFLFPLTLKRGYLRGGSLKDMVFRAVSVGKKVCILTNWFEVGYVFHSGLGTGMLFTAEIFFSTT